MIVDERLVTYINSLDTGNTPILDEIEREALASFVPIIRKEMQSFLKVLLSIKRPKRILEVGTAVGFSAILMAEYDPVGCEIITIENYEKRIPIARENFIRAEKEEQITLLEGDAKDVLETLTEPFDLIFMDAAKGQYLNFLPRVLELLQPEGILISDNVLQDGDIIEIDIPGRAINVKLTDEELAARPMTPVTRQREVSKSLKAYASMVSSADKGAVRLID